MRISSQQIFNIATNSMADANEALVKTQEQLSTGQRVLEPSDDPVATTKILAITEEIAGIKQYQRNIDIAKNDLTLEESILNGVNNVIQRMQELAVQAGNTATLSPTEYDSLADEVDSRIDELKNLLNSRSANGDYIFGGFKSTREPFTGSASTGFQYIGDEGQKFIKVSNSTRVAATDSGKDIFVDIDSAEPTINTSASQNNIGNPAAVISVGRVVDQVAYNEFYPEDMVITFNEDSAVAPASKNYTITEKSTGRVILANQLYTPGEDIEVNGVSLRITGNPASGQPGVAGDRFFVDSSNKQDMLTTLARFSDAMRSFDGAPVNRDAFEAEIALTIENLKGAQTSVLQTTSKIGARFNTLESIEGLHIDAELVLKEFMSELRDVDWAEASTRLAAQSLILEAAQTSFVRVSRLSLFNQL